MSTEDATPDTGASDVTARPIPVEVLAATKGARTVIAPTDEGRDDAYRQGRAAATCGRRWNASRSTSWLPSTGWSIRT